MTSLGNFLKPSLVGRNMVKGPSPLRTSSSPAKLTASRAVVSFAARINSRRLSPRIGWKIDIKLKANRQGDLRSKHEHTSGRRPREKVARVSNAVLMVEGFRGN